MITTRRSTKGIVGDILWALTQKNVTELKLVSIKANVWGKESISYLFYFFYLYFPTFLLPLKVSPS